MSDDRRVQLYDTTLRDGMQREGLSLTVGEQVAILGDARVVRTAHLRGAQRRE